MKKDVSAMESLSNYSIKKKHAQNIQCFFKSKNFELRTELRPATPPMEEKPTKTKPSNNSQLKKMKDDESNFSRASSVKRGPHMLIYSDNIEND